MISNQSLSSKYSQKSLESTQDLTALHMQFGPFIVRVLNIYHRSRSFRMSLVSLDRSSVHFTFLLFY